MGLFDDDGELLLILQDPRSPALGSLPCPFQTELCLSVFVFCCLLWSSFFAVYFTHLLFRTVCCNYQPTCFSFPLDQGTAWSRQEQVISNSVPGGSHSVWHLARALEIDVSQMHGRRTRSEQLYSASEHRPCWFLLR